MTVNSTGIRLGTQPQEISARGFVGTTATWRLRHVSLSVVGKQCMIDFPAAKPHYESAPDRCP
jgi:hypothetical protein